MLVSTLPDENPFPFVFTGATLALVDRPPCKLGEITWWLSQAWSMSEVEEGD